MKTITLTITLTFALFLSLSVFAQNCRMSADEFRLTYNSLRTTRSDQLTLDRSMDVLQTNCLSVAQVIEIANLFRSDSFRLIFTREAYLNVYNPEDYLDVLDKFDRFSSAFKLYDFILNGPTSAPPLPPTLPEEPACFTTGEEMRSIVATINKESFPMRRLGPAKSMTQNRCLSVGQIREVINLLAIGDDRLEFAKSSYNNCTDPLNYHQLVDAMTFQSEKDELLRFIQSRN